MSVAWSKLSGPGVVTFASQNSATTSAIFSAAGTYLLRLTADDTEYSQSGDVTITVNPEQVPVNQPPAVNPGPNQTIELPTDAVTLNGTATDDGLPAGSTLIVTWTQVSGPGTVTFDNAGSAVTTARFSALGDYVLRLSAGDGAYLISADVGVSVTPQNRPPTANAGPDQTILLSQPAQLDGSASDDGLPSGSALTTVWSKVSGPGTVTFTNPNVTVTGAQFSAMGTYVLRLTSSDSMLTASDELTVTVRDNVAVPTVEITSPGDGDELTGPTIITGSVSNGTWMLEYSLNSDDGAANQVWTQAAAGAGPVTNGLLGTLDTTLMLNGIYTLRLKATDEYGQISFTLIAVLVDKNFKVGQFQVAFSDLNVPVVGLPIEVVRSYDSRDKRVGDFGVGWQLGLRSARVEKTGVLGLGWTQTVTSGFIPTYCLEPTRPHKVAITFGDGKVFKFRASTAIRCQQAAPISATELTFTPEPGTHATLESTAATDVLVAVQGSIPGPVQLINHSNSDIYNTGTFRLRTAEGAVYVIDQRTGVSSVRDAYGNTLTINVGGIVHSSGQSIAFSRDGAGRITQIIDPNGNAQTYLYDPNGDLVSYTDREQQTTTFTYNSNHHLLSITNARGVELLTNQYDASGRLIGQADAFSKSLVYDHDIAGRVETMTDRQGQQTRYEYDERGNVLRQIDAKGGIKSFTYDANDNVLTETNALGKITTYTYDATDNRTSVTDPLGNVTRLTYNAARQPLTVTDPRGQVTINTYDAAGTNLLTTTDPFGKSTTFTYSVFTGQRTTMKDALDHVTHYGYDSAGRLNSETDALGHVTTFGYDRSGNRTTQSLTRTNAGGQTETITTTYTYDKLNRPTKTTFADSSFTLVEYNAIGQQAATIDQMGHRTEFTYDEMGRLTRTDYPDGKHDETTYDAEGRRLTSKDRAGRTTSFAYDELGRLTKTTYPDNTSTSTTYDAVGQVLTTTDARGNVTIYFYDAAGRRTKIRNALNQETTFAFDPNGNQISMTDALGHTTDFEYDLNNRRTRTTYADNSFDTVGYDALGRSVSRTDQAGKTTQFTYDALGRLTKVKDALNQETTYAYNELGQQLSQTDANNHTTRFEYDQLGRRVKRVLPAGQFETYAYDTGGNLQTRTDFNGKTTAFIYDVMRRLISKIPDASLNQPAISFTYNHSGQRATMSDASGTTIYTYDSRSRLSSKQTPFGTLSHTYDDSGNLLTTRSSNTAGTSIDYTYDALNRLATVRDNRLTTLNGGVTTYNYDTVGNLQSYRYPNSVTTSYNYNSLNRLTSMNAGTPVSALASYAYTLGPAGNRIAVTEHGGRTVNYSYDDLYRLTNETIANDPHGINGTVSYGYDPVGNRLSRTSSIPGVVSQNSTYDANDRLSADAYDANGNTKASSGKIYGYDFENRLTSLTNPDSSLITYVYDGDGNRVARTVDGITTNYLVDTNNHTGYAQVVEELQSSAVVKQFTYGHDLISQRCVSANASGTTNCALSFYGYDGHGSVRFLTDSAAAITDTYSYDAFGNLISRTGTTSNDYLYSGEQLDPNLGFYYLRARYMDPSSGRFWSMDSYEGGSYDPGSLHKYLYTRNSPTNLIDPNGHFSLVDTLNTSVVVGVLSGFTFGLVTGGLEGAINGAIQGAVMGALVPLTGAGVGTYLLGNAARGVFITGWGLGLGNAATSGFSFATATTEEERTSAGIDLLTSAGFMYFGPKILQRVNTKIISAEQANIDSARRGYSEAPWSAGLNVTETTLFSMAKYVRVYAGNQLRGAYVMEASEIQGLTALQMKQKFALPFLPDKIAIAEIPAGTTIRIGVAGPNSFAPKGGGGMQVEIQNPNHPTPPTPPTRFLPQ
ncbi:MAG TPA: RHS repeat-associated core domain-containing protein [Pyrinomonadaceae bacterium]|nr:RHS repeat-associated core domain-containing protein [Pyrinomonadaceae bacterium]